LHMNTDFRSTGFTYDIKDDDSRLDLTEVEYYYLLKNLDSYFPWVLPLNHNITESYMTWLKTLQSISIAAWMMINMKESFNKFKIKRFMDMDPLFGKTPDFVDFEKREVLEFTTTFKLLSETEIEARENSKLKEYDVISRNGWKVIPKVVHINKRLFHVFPNKLRQFAQRFMNSIHQYFKKNYKFLTSAKHQIKENINQIKDVEIDDNDIEDMCKTMSDGFQMNDFIYNHDFNGNERDMNYFYKTILNKTENVESYRNKIHMPISNMSKVKLYDIGQHPSVTGDYPMDKLPSELIYGMPLRANFYTPFVGNKYSMVVNSIDLVNTNDGLLNKVMKILRSKENNPEYWKNLKDVNTIYSNVKTTIKNTKAFVDQNGSIKDEEVNESKIKFGLGKFESFEKLREEMKRIKKEISLHIGEKITNTGNIIVSDEMHDFVINKVSTKNKKVQSPRTSMLEEPIVDLRESFRNLDDRESNIEEMVLSTYKEYLRDKNNYKDAYIFDKVLNELSNLIAESAKKYSDDVLKSPAATLVYTLTQLYREIEASCRSGDSRSSKKTDIIIKRLPNGSIALFTQSVSDITSGVCRIVSKVSKDIIELYDIYLAEKYEKLYHFILYHFQDIFKLDFDKSKFENDERFNNVVFIKRNLKMLEKVKKFVNEYGTEKFKYSKILMQFCGGKVMKINEDNVVYSTKWFRINREIMKSADSRFISFAGASAFFYTMGSGKVFENALFVSLWGLYSTQFVNILELLYTPLKMVDDYGNFGLEEFTKKLLNLRLNSIQVARIFYNFMKNFDKYSNSVRDAYNKGLKSFEVVEPMFGIKLTHDQTVVSISYLLKIFEKVDGVHKRGLLIGFMQDEIDHQKMLESSLCSKQNQNKLFNMGFEDWIDMVFKKDDWEKIAYYPQFVYQSTKNHVNKMMSVGMEDWRIKCSEPAVKEASSKKTNMRVESVAISENRVEQSRNKIIEMMRNLSLDKDNFENIKKHIKDFLYNKLIKDYWLEINNNNTAIRKETLESYVPKLDIFFVESEESNRLIEESVDKISKIEESMSSNNKNENITEGSIKKKNINFLKELLISENINQIKLQSLEFKRYYDYMLEHYPGLQYIDKGMERQLYIMMIDYSGCLPGFMVDDITYAEFLENIKTVLPTVCKRYNEFNIYMQVSESKRIDAKNIIDKLSKEEVSNLSKLNLETGKDYGFTSMVTKEAIVVSIKSIEAMLKIKGIKEKSILDMPLYKLCLYESKFYPNSTFVVLVVKDQVGKNKRVFFVQTLASRNANVFMDYSVRPLTKNIDEDIIGLRGNEKFIFIEKRSRMILNKNYPQMLISGDVTKFGDLYPTGVFEVAICAFRDSGYFKEYESKAMMHFMNCISNRFVLLPREIREAWQNYNANKPVAKRDIKWLRKFDESYSSYLKRPSVIANEFGLNGVGKNPGFHKEVGFILGVLNQFGSLFTSLILIEIKNIWSTIVEGPCLEGAGHSDDSWQVTAFGIPKWYMFKSSIASKMLKIITKYNIKFQQVNSKFVCNINDNTIESLREEIEKAIESEEDLIHNGETFYLRQVLKNHIKIQQNNILVVSEEMLGNIHWLIVFMVNRLFGQRPSVLKTSYGNTLEVLQAQLRDGSVNIPLLRFCLFLKDDNGKSPASSTMNQISIIYNLIANGASEITTACMIILVNWAIGDVYGLNKDEFERNVNHPLQLGGLYWAIPSQIAELSIKANLVRLMSSPLIETKEVIKVMHFNNEIWDSDNYKDISKELYLSIGKLDPTEETLGFDVFVDFFISFPTLKNKLTKTYTKLLESFSSDIKLATKYFKEEYNLDFENASEDLNSLVKMMANSQIVSKTTDLYYFTSLRVLQSYIKKSKTTTFKDVSKGFLLVHRKGFWNRIILNPFSKKLREMSEIFNKEEYKIYEILNIIKNSTLRRRMMSLLKVSGDSLIRSMMSAEILLLRTLKIEFDVVDKIWSERTSYVKVRNNKTMFMKPQHVESMIRVAFDSLAKLNGSTDPEKLRSLSFLQRNQKLLSTNWFLDNCIKMINDLKALGFNYTDLDKKSTVIARFLESGYFDGILKMGGEPDIMVDRFKFFYSYDKSIIIRRSSKSIIPMKVESVFNNSNNFFSISKMLLLTMWLKKISTSMNKEIWVDLILENRSKLIKTIIEDEESRMYKYKSISKITNENIEEKQLNLNENIAKHESKEIFLKEEIYDTNKLKLEKDSLMNNLDMADAIFYSSIEFKDAFGNNYSFESSIQKLTKNYTEITSPDSANSLLVYLIYNSMFNKFEEVKFVSSKDGKVIGLVIHKNDKNIKFVYYQGSGSERLFVGNIMNIRELLFCIKFLLFVTNKDGNMPSNLNILNLSYILSDNKDQQNRNERFVFKYFQGDFIEKSGGTMNSLKFREGKISYINVKSGPQSLTYQRSFYKIDSVRFDFSGNSYKDSLELYSGRIEPPLINFDILSENKNSFSIQPWVNTKLNSNLSVYLSGKILFSDDNTDNSKIVLNMDLKLLKTYDPDNIETTSILEGNYEEMNYKLFYAIIKMSGLESLMDDVVESLPNNIFSISLIEELVGIPLTEQCNIAVDMLDGDMEHLKNKEKSMIMRFFEANDLDERDKWSNLSAFYALCLQKVSYVYSNGKNKSSIRKLYEFGVMFIKIASRAKLFIKEDMSRIEMRKSKIFRRKNKTKVEMDNRNENKNTVSTGGLGQNRFKKERNIQLETSEEEVLYEFNDKLPLSSKGDFYGPNLIMLSELFNIFGEITMKNMLRIIPNVLKNRLQTTFYVYILMLMNIGPTQMNLFKKYINYK